MAQWYETFFRGVALDCWRQAVTPEWTAGEVEFLEKALEAPGGRLLDVPSGNGRHSIALARRGYRVTGVDISEEFVAEARQAATGLAAEFRLGDMRDLPWEAEFDGAFCFGNSFGYLDHAGARTFLAALARALKPGGRLVIENPMVAESILTNLVPQRWYRVGDILMLSENRYDAAASRLDIDYTFIRDGVIDTRPVSSYVLSVAELRRMVAEAGFEVVAAYGGTGGEPYQLRSPDMLLVARRR